MEKEDRERIEEDAIDELDYRADNVKMNLEGLAFLAVVTLFVGACLGIYLLLFGAGG